MNTQTFIEHHTNSKVRELLKAWDTALRSGDREKYRSARANLHKGITLSKREYKQLIEANFNGKNPFAMWQGVKGHH